jgi:GPH family glycoside/pentoside/hexuronide:cation symporter
MVIPLVLLTDEATTELNPLFKPIMLLVAVISGIILFASSHALTENEYARKEETLGFIKSMSETLRNKEFLAFEGMNFFREMAMTIVTGLMIYFVQYVVELQGFVASMPLFLVFIMMLSFSYIANKMVKTRGLKQVYIIGMVITGFSLILVFFSGRILVAVMLSMLMVGVGLAPVLLIWSPLLSDVIDYDELRTGKRRETTYAGMNALISKPSISIANALFLLFISGFGFDNALSIQPESAIVGIQIGYALFPALFLIIGAFIFWRWYGLDGQDWLQKKDELTRVHIQKEMNYVEQLRREGKISKVYQRLHGDSEEDA